MAWDLNICMDWEQNVLVPFHYFVEPQSRLSQRSPSQPFHFFHLPTDLQLCIYEHCDLPTLFQLMRTCSRTRGPATKLFWNNPSETHWYHSDNYALFEYGTRHHPIIQHCPEFARHVTRIELNLLRLEQFFAQDDGDNSFRKPVSTGIKAQDFWGRINRAFPAIKRVVLMGASPRRPLPPPPGEFDKAYTTIETVGKCAPPHIVLQVALDDGQLARPRRYTLWQISNSLESSWQVVDQDWAPTRILLPPRRFTDSPLGNLLTFNRRNYALLLETRGIDWLMIESYARYAIDGVIRCPRLDCDGIFTARSQWKQHLKITNHWRLRSRYACKGEHTEDLLCFKGTPDAEQAAIEARQRRIDAAYQQTRKLQLRVGCGWGKEGTVQRRLFEEQFFGQLREENFAAPGELLMEGNQPTCEWFQYLHMYFDHTHA